MCVVLNQAAICTYLDAYNIFVLYFFFIQNRWLIVPKFICVMWMISFFIKKMSETKNEKNAKHENAVIAAFICLGLLYSYCVCARA